VECRAGLDDVEKKILDYRDSNSDPSVVQPVASCCTDCPLPASILERRRNYSLRFHNRLVLMWILFLGTVTSQVHTAIVIFHWSVVACEDISGVGCIRSGFHSTKILIILFCVNSVRSWDNSFSIVTGYSRVQFPTG
jgi:hypothetical protein